MQPLTYLQRLNRRIEAHIAPEKRNRRDTYRDIVSDIDFSRALHLGSGRDKHRIGADLEEHGDVVALDPDASGLATNQTQTRVLGDGQRLPFESDTFDLVFSEYVFEHLPNPQSALDEINRVLRSGGSFVVLVPNPRHYYARIADATPFWFHKLWFRLQGVDNAEQDRFPTQYEWGTYDDLVAEDITADWSIESFYSFPGPTGYTRILPAHFAFVLVDRLMVDQPQHHVCYLAQYTKTNGA